jgi:hypothetical protein
MNGDSEQLSSFQNFLPKLMSRVSESSILLRHWPICIQQVYINILRYSDPRNALIWKPVMPHPFLSSMLVGNIVNFALILPFKTAVIITPFYD